MVADHQGSRNQGGMRSNNPVRPGQYALSSAFPGGANHRYARLMSQWLSERFDQQDLEGRGRSQRGRNRCGRQL